MRTYPCGCLGLGLVVALALQARCAQVELLPAELHFDTNTSQCVLAYRGMVFLKKPDPRHPGSYFTRTKLENTPLRLQYGGVTHDFRSAKHGYLEGSVFLGHFSTNADFYTVSLGDRTYTNTVVHLERAKELLITDIDDTIKETQVLDKGKMIRNTFFDEFRPVKGMVERFRDLTGTSLVGVVYLSASPPELGSPLQAFLVRAGFPSGVLRLRGTSMASRTYFEGSVASYKEQQIRLVIQQHGKPMTLVGDSGQNDPEVYSRIDAEFPALVKRIIIRSVRERPMTEKRLRKLSSKVEVVE